MILIIEKFQNELKILISKVQKASDDSDSIFKAQPPIYSKKLSMRTKFPLF